MQVLVQVTKLRIAHYYAQNLFDGNLTGFKWIAAATLVLIHAIVSPEVNYGGKVDLNRGTSFD